MFTNTSQCFHKLYDEVARIILSAQKYFRNKGREANINEVRIFQPLNSMVMGRLVSSWSWLLVMVLVLMGFVSTQPSSLVAQATEEQTVAGAELKENGTVAREDFNYFREQREGEVGNGDTDPGTGKSENVFKLIETGALGNIDVKAFGSILIHEGGRVKPLDSYARTTLLIFNGRSTFKDIAGRKHTALAWLVHTIFEPELALGDRIFKITFEDVLHALGITPHESKRYAFTDISPRIEKLQRLANFAYQQAAGKRSPASKEFIRIYENYVLHYQLLSSFVYALPSETFSLPVAEVKTQLGLPVHRVSFSYLEIMEISKTLFALDEQIRLKPQETLVSEEIIIQELVNRYKSFPLSFGELPFRLLPSYSHETESWFSPWQVFAVNTWENLVKKEIFALKSIVEAYRNINQMAFDDGTQMYQAYLDDKLTKSGVRYKAQWELLYHRLDPFYRASFCLGFAFLGMLGFFAFPAQRGLRASLKRGAWLLMALGLMLTFIGMMMRVIITERPPITNLFSTFIFVAFVTGIGGLLLEKYERHGVGLLTGSLSAVVLLLISNYFGAEGDTLQVLVAVLRSNFWLSTHVIAINLGYGGIVLSGVIAHVYLIKRILYEQPFRGAKILPLDKVVRRERQDNLKNVLKLIYATQGFGLIFTVLGTILGGIWADQSWGRFWGWDPKENGSLLIVLWSALIFHSKFGGLVRAVGFASGAVLGIIVVMVAWFGINLLGVGLHSYGFTEGIAFPLALYIVLQFTILFFLVYFIKYAESMRQFTK